MSVTPIRPGVSPEVDSVRELIDFCVQNIESFAEGDEPVSIALVVLGKRSAGAITWSLNPDRTVPEVAGAAGAMLINRAATCGHSD